MPAWSTLISLVRRCNFSFVSAEQKIYGESADELKPFEEVLLADPRQAVWSVMTPSGFRKVTLEDHHKRVTHLVLSASVPAGIRESFDTARNLYVYSWFVYPFQTVAELQAYTVLEAALRLRIQREENQSVYGLAACFDHAFKRRWLRDDGVRYYQKLIERQKRVAGCSGGAESIDSSAAPTDQWLRRVGSSFRQFRNDLAHGDFMLLGQTVRTLEICCDVINQIFPESAPTEKSF